MGLVLEDRLTAEDERFLLLCNEKALQARESGNHPFAALLVDKKGRVLMSSHNEFRTGGSSYHAETLLTLRAAKKYSPEVLAECTLYTNFEPCVMCTGAVYWANIGRIVYGVSERELLRLTGDNEENPTFSLSCRDVIRAGQKTLHVAGPSDNEELKAVLLKAHEGFWT